MIEYIVSDEHIERVNMTLLAFKRVKIDLDGMPEIVRCRDCWNFNNDYEPAECRMTGLDVAGYDYCSQGERRES